MKSKPAAIAAVPANDLRLIGGIAFIAAKHDKEQNTYNISHKILI